MSETREENPRPSEPSTAIEVSDPDATTECCAAARTFPWTSVLLNVGLRLVLAIFPIAQIVIGARHQHDCPRQIFIPIFLELMGSFNLLFLLITIPFTVRVSENKIRHLAVVGSCLFSLIGFFVIGSSRIYLIYEPNYNEFLTDLEPYCDKTLYLFAFWSSTVCYILLGLCVLCGCCFFCVCLLCINHD